MYSFLSQKYICMATHVHMNILRPWWAHYVARALEMSCNKLKKMEWLIIWFCNEEKFTYLTDDEDPTQYEFSLLLK